MVSTGTIDKFLTIKDQTNGETLWTYEMDAEGAAAPLIYNHNNKSYIAIATGGLYPDSNRESCFIFLEPQIKDLMKKKITFVLI